jgi:opacity protein-like surface antigen
MKRIICAAVALAACASPAIAWHKVTATDDANSCAIGQTFDGPGNTQVLVVQTSKQFDDGVIGIAIFNDNWSLKKGDEISESIGLETDGYGIADAGASALDKGMLITLSPKMIDEMAQLNPAWMAVSKGKTEIARFNMNGFYVEYLMFDRCIAKKREALANRNRLERLEKNMPKDPFAK